jgi:hypothetical protein
VATPSIYLTMSAEPTAQPSPTRGATP